ncbi:MAG: tetratricopeptide repeat protein [Anaerolineae bacterium]
MGSPLIIPLVGLVYLLGFGALSFVRGQGLSARFAVEGLIITAIGSGLHFMSASIHPLAFLIVLYLFTMRVRLLIDIGNWLSARGGSDKALVFYRLALSLGPDFVSRQIVLINRGVAQLHNQDPEGACVTLEEVLDGEDGRIGSKHLAASYYNLGLACRRSGREAEAIRRFNQAIDAWPNSVYGQAAERELNRQAKEPGVTPE